MAGSISLSLSQQFDSTGAPLNGGLLYFYAAGTTTPQSAYQDYSLTLPWPNPMVLDSAGRIPAFYLADGQIKIRLTDSAGVTQVSADNLLVVGASAGTGTPPTVDATTVAATGDTKWRYGTGVHTGWVRINGRTIGSAASGGTERANADCQSLFEYLWAQDSTDLLLTVSTGRGASAAADWAANKNITLPDARGRSFFGPDSMGSTSAGNLGSGAGTFLTTDDTVGATAGSEVKTLLTANLPAYTPSGNIGSFSGNAAVPARNYSTTGSTVPTQVSLASNVGADAGTLIVALSSLAATFTGTAQGGISTPFDKIPPAIIFTPYMKL